MGSTSSSPANIGYGHIGSLVATYGRAFGMWVLAGEREGSCVRAQADGIEAAAVGVYQRSAGHTQPTSSQGGQTVYDQPTVTPGQLHLTYKVQYAYREYTAQDSATQTDANMQDCTFLIFGCRPATATETVK